MISFWKYYLYLLVFFALVAVLVELVAYVPTFIVLLAGIALVWLMVYIHDSFINKEK
jgi:hypothetical protein